MRILITNDDGIHAPGLEACEKIARELSDELWIVAPESDQSGVSHSLSLNDPLRLREVAERHFAVKGTPTDFVIMGARHLMKEMPDLVLSGVNRGRNCAEDVSYSGTVAGAMEGTVLGIPSFSLSQAYAFSTKHTPHWETAIKFAPDLIRRVLKAGMPRDVLVNVNFPDCPPGEVAGTAIVTQGKRDQELLRIDARHEGQAALAQDFGDRIDLLAVEIDVENGGAEIAMGRELARLGDGADRRGHVVAEVGEHVLQQHADEIFVLDHEKARHSSRSIAHHRLPAHSCIPASLHESPANVLNLRREE